MTTADEKMREEFRHWWIGSKYRQVIFADESVEQVAFDGWQASAAQYSARIKEQKRKLKKSIISLLKDYGLSDGNEGWIEHDGIRDPLSIEGELIFALEANAERIKELEQQNEQLQSQASSACEFYQSIIDANYRTWDCGLDNAEEFVRWIKSRAAHALSLSDTQTAEAYKRRIQAEALEAAAQFFIEEPNSASRRAAKELDRMAAELKEGE